MRRNRLLFAVIVAEMTSSLTEDVYGHLLIYHDEAWGYVCEQNSDRDNNLCRTACIERGYGHT